MHKYGIFELAMTFTINYMSINIFIWPMVLLILTPNILNARHFEMCEDNVFNVFFLTLLTQARHFIAVAKMVFELCIIILETHTDRWAEKYSL